MPTVVLNLFARQDTGLTNRQTKRRLYAYPLGSIKIHYRFQNFHLPGIKNHPSVW